MVIAVAFQPFLPFVKAHLLWVW